MKKKEVKRKKFRKPRILKIMEIETRAGYCGTTTGKDTTPRCTIQFS